jgi:hypothetical protein
MAHILTQNPALGEGGFVQAIRWAFAIMAWKFRFIAADRGILTGYSLTKEKHGWRDRIRGKI